MYCALQIINVPGQGGVVLGDRSEDFLALVLHGAHLSGSGGVDFPDPDGTQDYAGQSANPSQENIGWQGDSG